MAPRPIIAALCLPLLFSGIATVADVNGAVAKFSHFSSSVPALFAALTMALLPGAVEPRPSRVRYQGIDQYHRPMVARSRQ